MTPVDQDIFVIPGEPARGNCQQAAVASMLGLPLADVPNFHNSAEGFWGGYHTFLKSRGLVDVEMPGNRAPGCFYLAYGPSPRGDFLHAVIYRDGALAHDPHPSRDGLRGINEIHLIVPISLEPK